MMAEDKKKPRKPVVGSRAPASAPRKIAGREVRQEPTDPAHGVVQKVRRKPKVPKLPRPERNPVAAGGVLTREMTTRVLAGVLAVLTVAAAGLGWYLLDDPSDGGSGSSSCYEADRDFEIPDHPVTVSDLDWRAAREASTESVVKILTVNWKTYDKHLEDVQKLMTREWAEKEYVNTARDTRANFLKNKADYKFAVAGESVVCASADKITSLLFLNQYVYKGTGDNRVGPDVYQVRVIVTAVRKGETWLVDRLDAL
jgi:hypothetical protein